MLKTLNIVQKQLLLGTAQRRINTESSVDRKKRKAKTDFSTAISRKKSEAAESYSQYTVGT